MPDDIEMSAEQETEEEMSIEEQEALFDQDESEYDETDDTSTDEDAEDEEAADDSDDEEEDEESADDSDDTEEDSDEEDSDDDAEEEESEDDDEDPLADIKKKAAALKQSEQDAADKATADAERGKNMEVAKADALKELFDSDKITGKDGEEIDMAEFRETYGAELEGVMAAMAFKMMGSTVEKAMESSGYASNEEVQALRKENANMQFKAEIAHDHPEVWQLENNKEFWKWVNEQGEDVNTLVDSGVAANVSAVIGAYKKASIKKTNSVIDKKATAKKKQHTDLHGSTVRTKKGGKGKKAKRGGHMSEEEAAAEFDDYEVED